MAKHTRDLFVPLIDKNLGAGPDKIWVPIDLSTVFDLAFNAETETYGYIAYPSDSTEIKSYAPSMAQEIVLDSSNPLYKVMRPFCMSLPKGGDARVPVLIAMPDLETDNPTDGYLWEQATITPGNLNTIDGKLAFTLNLNGAVQTGTVSGIGSGTVTFVAD